MIIDSDKLLKYILKSLFSLRMVVENSYSSFCASLAILERRARKKLEKRNFFPCLLVGDKKNRVVGWQLLNEEDIFAFTI